MTKGPAKTMPGRGKVWVTRRDVGVDRMASAWLIRRFVDRRARFKFVDDENYSRRPGEQRFDMFEGEFSHEGDLCTFEVLLKRAGLKSPALRKIGQAVHVLDLKDGKYPAPEAPGLIALLDGICRRYGKDPDRLDQSYEVFEALYKGLS